MANWHRLFIAAVSLPGLAAAADPAMLELVMPDAGMVMEMNLDRIAASPLGLAMSNQMKGELAGFRPSWQDPSVTAGLDWNHYAQEILMASAPAAPGKPASSIVIVRGLLDPALIESLGAFRGAKTNYLGVPILSNGPGAPVVAFLDGSISVIGQSADVKAAIARRGQNAPPSPALTEGLNRYEGQFDVWLVSTAPIGGKAPVGPSMKWLERTESFTGGIRVSPDFELSAQMNMRSEKEVADMADSLRWFAGVVQTQENTSISLEDLNFRVDGKTLSLALQVPEPQIRAALQHREVGKGTRARSSAVRAPEVANGLPEPPSGTIRVQSSPADMGTVLVPVRAQ